MSDARVPSRPGFILCHAETGLPSDILIPTKSPECLPKPIPEKATFPLGIPISHGRYPRNRLKNVHLKGVHNLRPIPLQA